MFESREALPIRIRCPGHLNRTLCSTSLEQLWAQYLGVWILSSFHVISVDMRRK